MKDNEYWKELSIYYFTDYDFHKKMDLQAEEIKEQGVKGLQSMVDMLKSHLPKDKLGKPGKVIKIKIRCKYS